MDIITVLAANLKRLRKETGLSQEAFADHSGIDRTYISGVERGVRNPTVVMLARIAKGLKVSAATLLEPPSPPDPTRSRPAR